MISRLELRDRMMDPDIQPDTFDRLVNAILALEERVTELEEQQMTRGELTEVLAEEFDTTVEEIEEACERFEIEPPWEAEVVEQTNTEPRNLTCGGCGGEEFNIQFNLEVGTDVWAVCASCGRRTSALDDLPGARKR